MSAADITIVRAIIQDQPVSVQEALILDGFQTSQRTKWFPIIPTSVTVTGVSAPSVDGQSGLLTWGSAPAAGTYNATYQFVLLLDATIQAFLDLQLSDDDVTVADSDVYRLAAAMALDAIASSQALILKKIEMLDLKTDGPAVAKALREHAATLRALVFEQGEDTFDIIEQINDTFGYQEKILKDAFRG